MTEPPIAVVFTSQVIFDGEYVNVPETMNTPFDGDHAGMRAHRFMRSERTRDFTEADGWRWHLWMNEAARVAYGNDLTDEMFGAGWRHDRAQG